MWTVEASASKPHTWEWGEQTVLINQLNYRFSSLRPDYENRIKNAGADDLLLWSKKILFAKNVDEVFEA